MIHRYDLHISQGSAGLASKIKMHVITLTRKQNMPLIELLELHL